MMTQKKRLIILVVAGIIALLAGFFLVFKIKKTTEVIKVGVLHSQTGPMAITEKPLIEAAIWAIEDINAMGGLLGKKVVPVIADGKSDWPTFANEAKRLITEEKVVAIFGCYTSASRKLVKEVVEKYNSLLFYSVQFEGLEVSPNIVYLGATANQQTIPAVLWTLQNLGKKLFLIGLDAFYPRVTNAIIKDLLAAKEGEVVGEAYAGYEQKNFDGIVQKIIRAQPQVIFNTLTGEANAHFSKALRGAGISTEKIPTMSISVTETELQDLNINDMIGDYSVQNYFESLDTPASKQFIMLIKQLAGKEQPISNVIENVFVGFRFWKNAVQRAGTTETNAVRAQLSERALSTAEGIISIDKKTQYTWKPVIIGKIFANKQFGIIWNSVSTIEPLPFPPLRTQEQWEQLLKDLYAQQGNKWQ